MGENDFVEEMKDSVNLLWEKALNNKLFRDLKKDAIEKNIYVNYLIIEYKFLNTAGGTMGYCLAKSPSLKEKYYLSENILKLATNQKNYFIKASNSFEFSLERNITSSKAKELTRGLHQHFKNIGEKGSYQEILACMLGAELLYLEFCKNAIKTIDFSNEIIKEWIKMHTVDDFRNSVDWLRNELNKYEKKLKGGDRKKLKGVFEKTLKEEIKFHKAPYHF